MQICFVIELIGNLVLFSGVRQSDAATHTRTPTLSLDPFPKSVITLCWVEFLMLHSRSLLVTCFTHRRRCLVVAQLLSHSLRRCGPQPARLPCPGILRGRTLGGAMPFSSFTYSSVCVWIPTSWFIPPPPPGHGNRDFVSLSVCLFLFLNKLISVIFYKPHVSVMSCGICPSLSDLPHWVWPPPSPSMSLQMPAPSNDVLSGVSPDEMQNSASESALGRQWDHSVNHLDLWGSCPHWSTILWATERGITQVLARSLLLTLNDK